MLTVRQWRMLGNSDGERSWLDGNPAGAEFIRAIASVESRNGVITLRALTFIREQTECTLRGNSLPPSLTDCAHVR